MKFDPILTRSTAFDPHHSRPILYFESLNMSQWKAYTKFTPTYFHLIHNLTQQVSAVYDADHINKSKIVRKRHRHITKWTYFTIAEIILFDLPVETWYSRNKTAFLGVLLSKTERTWKCKPTKIHNQKYKKNKNTFLSVAVSSRDNSKTQRDSNGEIGIY